MQSEWITYSVVDLIQKQKLFVGDGYRAKNDELGVPGLPFARGANINGGFNFQDADLIEEKNLVKAGNKISQPGDVVFTSKGTVGRFALVKPYTPSFVYSPQLSFWRIFDKDLIYPRYLYYWMHGREFFLQFNGVKGQTDMADYVSLSDQRKMSISLPNLDEQKEIAAILGSLDDKIELNQRMNETLEEMARALFKAWFVDFAPVRAKMEGREPEGMDAETGALFPDRLVESELGEIPEGWELKNVHEIAHITSGKRPEQKVIFPTFEFSIPQYGGAGIIAYTNKALYQTPLILTGRVGTLGVFHRVTVPSWPSDNTLVIVVNDKTLYEYLFLCLKQIDLKTLNRGSTQPLITQGDIKQYQILVPNMRVIKIFHEFLATLFLKIELNEIENNSLTRVRDELLPKLLSGQVRVGGIETFV